MQNTIKPEKDKTNLFGTATVAIITGIVILLVVFLFISINPGTTTIVPAATCGEKVMTYINGNLVQQGTSASLISVNETRGLYAIQSRYQSQTITIYATRDCTLLFTNSIDMNAAPEKAAPAQPPKKTSRPDVELFVMSFCPYGTQAETVIRPVLDLLGTTADFHVRYITMSNGSTLNDIVSLHGPLEAKEDLRQLCIMKADPSKFWDYLKVFNDRCYPSWQNASVLDTCRKNITASLGIDLQSTESCAFSGNGISLLKADEQESATYGVTGSPTLVINGVEYTGPRTPEGYKEAICNSYNTQPASCNTTLSAVAATNAAGGC